MNLHRVTLNSKIPFILSEISDGENIIYCNSFNDYLFNVGVFKTKEKEIVLEYITNNKENFTYCDVTFENGESYKNVEFKIIVSNKGELPYSVFDRKKLGNNKTVVEQIKEKPHDIIKEEVVISKIKNEEFISKDELQDIVKKKELYEKATQNALQKERELNALKKTLKEQKVILENSKLIESKISDFKSELLEEYILTINKQKDLLDKKFENKFDDVLKNLNEKITYTFEKYESYLKNTDEVNKEHQLDIVLKKLDESIKVLKTNILDVAEKSKKDFYQKIEKDSIIALTEQASLLENRYKDKLLLELESYKIKLLNTIKDISEHRVDDLLNKRKLNVELSLLKTIDEERKKFKKQVFEKSKAVTDELNDLSKEFSKKLPSIQKSIVQLEEKVKNISNKKDKFVYDFSKEQLSTIDSIAKKWALKILDLGGGGGSVAVQLAKGGTIAGNLDIQYGNLNVTGNILSGGQDLVSIFSSGGGGDVPKYESTYSTVKANSANWDYAFSQIDVTTSIINYLSGQIDENVFQNVNSTFETIGEFVSNPHPNVYKGYTVTLVNKRVYVLAGNDQNNTNHYIELNANPITPIYVEESLSATGVVIDLYSLMDFRSAKYTIQVQTNYNNDIYFSEINTIGAVGPMQSVAVEYGQNFTTQLIDSYTTFIQGGKLYLSANFINYYNDSAKKYIFKGLRTNLYKI